MKSPRKSLQRAFCMFPQLREIEKEKTQVFWAKIQALVPFIPLIVEGLLIARSQIFCYRSLFYPNGCLNHKKDFDYQKSILRLLKFLLPKTNIEKLLGIKTFKTFSLFKAFWTSQTHTHTTFTTLPFIHKIFEFARIFHLW